MSFEVGDMVVCLESRQTGYGCEQQPQVNGVYTVRAVLDIQGTAVLLLDEIFNSARAYREGFIEMAFEAKRFRKIRKPDIQIFRDIVERINA